MWVGLQGAVGGGPGRVRTDRLPRVAGSDRDRAGLTAQTVAGTYGLRSWSTRTRPTRHVATSRARGPERGLGRHRAEGKDTAPAAFPNRAGWLAMADLVAVTAGELGGIVAHI